MKSISFFGVCIVLGGSFVLLSCSKGGGNPVPPAITPEVSVTNVSKERTINDATYTFYASLNVKTMQDVTVRYSTEENTAKAGVDFTPASGMVTIPAGETSAPINIEVSGDSLRGDNQVFYVKLDQPTNATLRISQGTGTILNTNGWFFVTDNTGYSTPTSYAGYQLAWADEFDGNSLNNASWTYELGASGWGNNELQNYTNRPQNVLVSNGYLMIEARAETYQNSQYTSARLITKNKKVFTYGRVDIRAKLPKTQGIWPALWMLGNNIDAVSWPACGEIDIMELLGQEPSKMYNTLHYGASNATKDSYGSSYTLPDGSFDEAFHVFSMDWKKDTITMYVDDKQVFFANKAIVGDPYPFNAPFFFIFNVAVGGNWPGSPNATTQFPQRMVVDYVRVFQK